MRKLLICILIPGILCIACKSRPEKVMSSGKMTEVLADIYKGEAMIDLSFGKFREDSARAKVREAVFEKHGINQEVFDSSLSYYGRNIIEYVEIHDNLIKELEKENRRVGRGGNGGTLNVGGDSVNVWPGSPRYVLTGRTAEKMLTFNLPSDENWEPGDNYTWQFKLYNKSNQVEAGVYIDYEDGSTDIVNSAVDRDGWNRITVSLDTARTPAAVYGYAKFTLAPDELIFIDSLSLIRKRLSDDVFRRRFVQRRFLYGTEK